MSSLILTSEISANPQGGVVIRGSGSISSTPNSTVINQTSGRAVINWQSFNINQGESTHFQQPNGGVALNRINGQQGASQIYGRLTATGQIILVNPAGIYFGPTAFVNVGGIIASSADISDQNFMNGIYKFNNAHAAVKNEGTIKAADYGMVALIGSQVENSGHIEANLGHVLLGSGSAFTINFVGNDLIAFAVDDKPQGNARIKNTGSITANGGRVLITANAAKSVLDHAINMNGVVEARGVVNHNNEIILTAGEGDVNVSGKLIVASKAKGLKGGKIEINAKKITLTENASLDARGDAGGGSIFIGGKSRGVPTADFVQVQQNAHIDVSAIGKGNGGTALLLANNAMHFYGAIDAKGGALGGNGGFVEVSGLDFLDFKGQVNTSAPLGAFGTLLLDPKNLIVANSGTLYDGITNLFFINPTGTTVISPASINNQLSHVFLQANNDLTFLDDINMTTNGVGLTGQAGRNIMVDANITTTNGAINLIANDSHAVSFARDSGTGNILFSANKSLNAGSGNVSLEIGSSEVSPFSPGAINFSANNHVFSIGQISLMANNINFGDSNVQIGGMGVGSGFANRVIFAPSTSGTSIGINGASGDLALAGEDLAKVRTLNARIGDSNTGHIALNAWTLPTTFAENGSLTLFSNDGISQTGVLNLTNNHTDLILRGDGIFQLSEANLVENLAASLSGDLTLKSTYGSSLIISSLSDDLGGVSGISADHVTLMNPQTGILLNAPIQATGSGDAITLSGQSFTNNFGSLALAADNGRYLIWSEDPVNDRRNGLAYDFKQYNASFGNTAVLGSGNGFLYTLAPTITPQLIGSISKVYDATTLAHLSPANFSFLGGVDGDTVVLSTPTEGNYNNKNVGLNKNITADGISIASASNDSAIVYGYSLANTSASNTIGTITPANLSASLTDSISKTYDTTVQAPVLSNNIHSNTLLNDEVAINFAAAIYDNKNVGVNKLVTVSGLTLSGPDSGNYQLENTSISNTVGIITPANISVNLTGNINKIYDTTTLAHLSPLNYAVSGILGSDQVNLNNPSLGDYDNPNAGTGKRVTVEGLMISGSGAGNYHLVNTEASANIGVITPALLTVNLTGEVSKVYDTTILAHLNSNNYQLNGVLGADRVSLNNPTLGFYDTPNVGTNKLISVMGLALTGEAAGNYQVPNAVSGNIGVITRAPLNVVLDPTSTVTKVYDTTTLAHLNTTNYNLSGILGSDNVSLSNFETGFYDTPQVGSEKLVTVNGLGLSGTQANNYQLNQTSVSEHIGIITPASLTVALTGEISKVYDTTTTASLSPGNFILTGVLGGDAVNLNSATLGQYDTPNVGSNKLVTVDGLTISGVDSSNYQLASDSAANAIGIITPAPLTVGLTGEVNKVYDTTTVASLSPGNFTLTGVLGGDSVNLNPATLGQYDTPNVGSNKLVTVDGLTISGVDSSNYQLTSESAANAIGIITPAPLTVGLTGEVNKVYDTTTIASLSPGNFTLTGVLGGDAVNLNPITTGEYDTPHVGTHKLVTVEGLEIGGVDASNYQLTSDTVMENIGTITPAMVSINGILINDKVFDGGTQAQPNFTNATLSGVLGEDVINVNTSSVIANFQNSGIGTQIPVTIENLLLEGSNPGDYHLTSPTNLAGNILPVDSGPVTEPPVPEIPNTNPPVGTGTNIIPTTNPTDSGSTITPPAGQIFPTDFVQPGTSPTINNVPTIDNQINPNSSGGTLTGLMQQGPTSTSVNGTSSLFTDSSSVLLSSLSRIILNLPYTPNLFTQTKSVMGSELLSLPGYYSESLPYAGYNIERINPGIEITTSYSWYAIISSLIPFLSLLLLPLFGLLFLLDAIRRRGKEEDDSLRALSFKLRTSLNDVIGFTDVLALKKANDLTPEQLIYLNDIAAGSKELLEELAEIESGKIRLPLKKDFFRDLSFRIRTGLTDILGFAKLLTAGIGGNIEPEQRDYLDDIIQSSSQLMPLLIPKVQRNLRFAYIKV